jgi:putative hemolysin
MEPHKMKCLQAAIVSAAIAALFLVAPAQAQQKYDGTAARVSLYCLNSTGKAVPVVNSDGTSSCAGGGIPVFGTLSASLGGFTPSVTGARMTPLSVTTSDSSGTLPTGPVTVVSNVGANPMYCNVNGVAATTSDQEITAGGGWFAFTIPTGVTTLHCIATGSSTSRTKFNTAWPSPSARR